MLSCRNPNHGKSIVKRWTEDGRFYAIQRCRKCDVWERLEIDALEMAKKPSIKREMIQDE
jgi:ssDNA-binding Zn-finger/Zn-ribbon topoisomerase 1